MSMAAHAANEQSANSPEHAAMLQLIGSFWVSRALYVAAKLGIADMVKYRAKTSEELAKAVGAHAASLYRVLRVLASIGVFAEDDQARFSLAPLGMALDAEAPGSLSAWAIVSLGDETYWAWGDLMHTVRTGETAFDHVFDGNLWTYQARHPEYAKSVDRALADRTAGETVWILAAYAFPSTGRIVDVGGGSGNFLIAALGQNPGLKGVLLELPHVAENARRRIADAGLGARCEVLAGDMFASVPVGGNVYVLSGIISSCDDARATMILRNCRRAMSPQAKLLLLERVLPATADDSEKTKAALLSDLAMMIMTGGRERTAVEYQSLLANAGFKLMQIVETRAPKCVIEAQLA